MERDFATRYVGLDITNRELHQLAQQRRNIKLARQATATPHRQFILWRILPLQRIGIAA